MRCVHLNAYFTSPGNNNLDLKGLQVHLRVHNFRLDCISVTGRPFYSYSDKKKSAFNLSSTR